MKLGKLYGIGIGTGDPEYLTLKAYNVLKNIDVIFTVISKNASDSVSKSVVEYIKPQGKVELLIFSMARDKEEREAKVLENAHKILAELEAGKDVAFATLGDSMTYSTFGYILKIILAKYPQIEFKVIPGINSFTTLAAKTKTILVENREGFHVIPSFKAEDVEKIEFPQNATTILLKTYKSRNALLERLKKEKQACPHIEVIYGENLGLKNEKIAYGIEEIEKLPESYLSLIMVKK